MKRPNKYASAPAGTRAAHKRTIGSPGALTITESIVRAGQVDARESAQALRRQGFTPQEIRLLIWEPMGLYRDHVAFGQGAFEFKSLVSLGYSLERA